MWCDHLVGPLLLQDLQAHKLCVSCSLRSSRTPHSPRAVPVLLPNRRTSMLVCPAHAVPWLLPPCGVTPVLEIAKLPASGDPRGDSLGRPSTRTAPPLCAG